MSALVGVSIYFTSKNILVSIVSGLLIFIPLTEIVTKIIQNILVKTVKPKLIPKMDLSKGIPKEDTTMVVIPTIIDSRKKGKRIGREIRSILSCK